MTSAIHFNKNLFLIISTNKVTLKFIIFKGRYAAMSLLTGGAISTFLGLLGLIFWWSYFVAILKGAVPVFLILGGVLAIYIGFDDIQDKLNRERQKQEEELARAREEIEAVKAQTSQYRDELDRLKEDAQKKSSQE